MVCMLPYLLVKAFVKEASRDFMATDKAPEMRIRLSPETGRSVVDTWKRHGVYDNTPLTKAEISRAVRNKRFTIPDYIKEMERRHGKDFPEEVATRKKLLTNMVNTGLTDNISMLGGATRTPDSVYDSRTGLAMSKHRNPLIIGHEVGHGMEYAEKPNLSGEKALSRSSGDAATVKKQMLTSEYEATKNVLDNFEPWKNRNVTPMSPKDRQRVASVLAAQTTYYDKDVPIDVKQGKTISTGLRPKLQRAKDIHSKSTSPRVRQKALQFASDMQHGAPGEKYNPFVSKNLWSGMNKGRRKQYIGHIKNHSGRLSGLFGDDAGKLYKSEMMRGLRRML